MTTRCLSTRHIRENFGDWVITNLDKHSDAYLYEANMADIVSKSQNLYSIVMNSKDTHLIDWKCAYCSCDIIVSTKNKRAHWRDLLCLDCKAVGFNSSLARNVTDFYKYLSECITKNQSVSDVIKMH